MSSEISSMTKSQAALLRASQRIEPGSNNYSVAALDGANISTVRSPVYN